MTYFSIFIRNASGKLASSYIAGIKILAFLKWKILSYWCQIDNIREGSIFIRNTSGKA